jgi:hypothetical protein
MNAAPHRGKAVWNPLVSEFVESGQIGWIGQIDDHLDQLLHVTAQLTQSCLYLSTDLRALIDSFLTGIVRDFHKVRRAPMNHGVRPSLGNSVSNNRIGHCFWLRYMEQTT